MATIKLTYAGQSVESEVYAGQHLRLWGVPPTYSEDGLAVSVWGAGELEPYPACLGSEMRLMGEFECRQESGAARVVVISLADGVEYA